MSGGPTTKRYTTEELKKLRQQGKSATGRSRVASLSEEQVEAAAAVDSEANAFPKDWHTKARLISPKVPISIRLDADLVEFFRNQGPGWQSRINAVLRAYSEAVRGVEG